MVDMTDLAPRRDLPWEEIDAPDDTPRQGEWMEIKLTDRYEHDADDPCGGRDYTDADGPLIEPTRTDPDYERYRIERRWVLVYVVHRGSNYIEVRTLPYGSHECTTSWRIHLDNWREELRRVEDPLARIQAGQRHWQQVIAAATAEMGRLMESIGLCDALPDAPGSETIALARTTGDAPASEYKGKLAAAHDYLPQLHKKIQRAGTELCKWMSAPTLPLMAEVADLATQQARIERRIAGVELYAGLGEDAFQCRKGAPADIDEPLHLIQAMHFMDEECLADYRVGGMDYKSIRGFDRWLTTKARLLRLFPYKRCMVAFRVRREQKERTAVSLGDFFRIQMEAEQDKRTFIYVRNGEQLWRVETLHDFGERLFPDLSQTLWSSDEPLWSSIDGEEMRTEASLVQQLGEDFVDEDGEVQVTGAKRLPFDDPYTLHRFDDTSVYFDDMQAAVARTVEEYNRVAVIVQGLLDRSEVLSPHRPTKIWDSEGFARFLRMHYIADRAIPDGPPPDFEAYKAELALTIRKGSMCIGQERLWIAGCRAKKRSQGRYDDGSSSYRYHDWWPSTANDPGPGYIAEVKRLHGETPVFSWMRRGLRRRAGSPRWGDDYPTVREVKKIPRKHLFNVSAYTPGDFRRFFDDPRTRATYLEWAPFLLAAEEWHATGAFRPTRRGVTW